MVNIGEAIRHFRKLAGLTQRSLAARAGVTPAYLCSIENAHREPGTALIKSICRALHVPPEVIFWEAVDPPKDLPAHDREICELAKKVLVRYYHAKGVGNERQDESRSRLSP